MAHITGFTIEGLAGRDGAVSYELNRHVNIFWGLNGSGKTSLLKILNSALDGVAEPLSRVPFRSAEVRLHSIDHGDFKRTVKVQERKTGHSERLAAYLALANDGALNLNDPEFAMIMAEENAGLEWKTIWPKGRRPSRPVTRLQHCYLPISRVAERLGMGRQYIPRAGSGRESLGEAWFDSVFADQVRSRWQRYNTKALGEIRDIQQQGLAEILSVLFGGSSKAIRTAPAAEDQGPAFDLVSQFLRRQSIRVTFDQKSFNQRYDQEEDLRDIVARIQNVMAQVDKALLPQNQFHKLIGELYTGDKRLELDSRDLAVIAGKHQSISLESLSSGEKQLLQILLEVLAGGPSSVIIDEPELSMHVDWQNRLVDAMRTINPECQLVLATHSPEVMANINESLIFEL